MKEMRLKTINLPWKNMVDASQEVPSLPEVDNHIKRLRWLRWALLILFVLNVLDGWLTIVWIKEGLAYEANPVMAYLLHIHPAVFMLVKLSLVFLGSLVLLRFYNKPMAIVGVILLLSVYSTLLVYHGKGMMMFAGL